MAIITQSDDPNNSFSFETDLDEFIPYIVIKNPKDIEGVEKVWEAATGLVKLSEHLDKDKQTLEYTELVTKAKHLKITFSVQQGSSKTWDDDGYIEPKLSVEDEAIAKITSAKEIYAKYGTEITVDIEITAKEDTEFFLDFYANDNDDYFHGEYKNVYCGRVKVSFVHQSRVGLRLTSNIESLPLAPTDYIEPPTFSEPKKTFEVANKYQNCRGMCFAVSMARVKKAYQDEFGVDVISLNLKNKDYLYSGTIITSIPENYFGYGVGGALAAKGYAELIDENGVWNGELEEGAMLQFWNNYNLVSFEKLKTAIKDKLKEIENDDFFGGHSVIFKSYIRDNSGKITGLNLYDYSGINRSEDKNKEMLFVGANLKDIE